MSTATDTVVGQVSREDQLRMVEILREVIALAPLLTPTLGGMTVKITNTGPWGWWSAPRGYVYVDRHPVTGEPWPPVPPLWLDIFRRFAAGKREPDCGHIVWYRPGAKLGKHRDKTERDKTGSVVTVSLGDPATWTVWDAFDAPSTTTLASGDVTLLEGRTRDYQHSIGRVKRPEPTSGQGDMFSTEEPDTGAWSPLAAAGRVAVSIRSGAGG